jgi:hypothetical protein
LFQFIIVISYNILIQYAHLQESWFNELKLTFETKPVCWEWLNVSNVQTIFIFSSANIIIDLYQTCGIKHIFQTKENHTEVRNVNKVFIICFWPEQRQLQKKNFLSIFNKHLKYKRNIYNFSNTNNSKASAIVHTNSRYEINLLGLWSKYVLGIWSRLS